MAEIVAGALSFGFPVAVYTLGADKKNSQGNTDVTGCSSNKREGKHPDMNLSASLRDMFAKSQRLIDSFSDEYRSDVSEESYRKSFGEGHASQQRLTSNSVEPPWFRNVVQSDVGTRACANEWSFHHEDAEYPWLKHANRYALRHQPRSNRNRLLISLASYQPPERIQGA